MSNLRLPNINQVVIAGRLVQDPEFTITENGAARLSTRVAINRPYRDRDGDWHQETSFVNIIAWRQVAEFASERLHKGSPVMVTGRLHSFSWRDSEENPHSLLEVQARSLQVLERADSSSETEEAILEQAGDEEEDFVLEAA
jgi:single-strand DNA-binding protein